MSDLLHTLLSLTATVAFVLTAALYLDFFQWVERLGAARQDQPRRDAERQAAACRGAVWRGEARDFNRRKQMNIVAIVNEKTNGARQTIEASLPYTVSLKIEGASDFLFHRWNAEAVDAKGKAAKGSAAKKTDDVETYVYRCADGTLGIPGEYVRQAIIASAKYKQDPRSPRKSAMDLYKAGVVSVTPLASLGVTDWDYLDTRRVMVQRNGINRTRPAMRAGWQVGFDFLVNLPEYIDRNSLREVVEQAGRLIGIGDFRPTYGRFGVISFE